MSKVRISFLLPTRGRPALVKRFFLSIAEKTFYKDQVEVILYVNQDDVASHHLDSAIVKVTRIIGPRASMGTYNSVCYGAANGDIIILANDDMVIRTQGWDKKIIEFDANVPDSIYLAYGNDLFKKKSFCTFPILSRRTCELLVEPYPKEYRHAFIDCHLFDIFKRLQYAGFDRICYMDDVVFEHLHYRVGKAPFDETYASQDRFDSDSTFIAMTGTRSVAAKRLFKVLRGEPLPPFQSAKHQEYVPLNILSAVSYFSQQLLFDLELPLRWRCFLWFWFIGRYLASRGFLRPFIK